MSEEKCPSCGRKIAAETLKIHCIQRGNADCGFRNDTLCCYYGCDTPCKYQCEADCKYNKKN